jgi:hypothetical protein
MGLVDKFEQGIIKRICRKDLRYVCRSKEEFNEAANNLDLQPRGFIDRLSYIVGYLMPG